MGPARARPHSSGMRDTGSEHVWSRSGPQIRLPRARRVSLKTTLIAAPLLTATAFAMVGFVAAPAGSPPPPPAVAAEPMASLLQAPRETPPPPATSEVEPTPSDVSQADSPPPHCRPTAHRFTGHATTGAMVFSNLDNMGLSIFDPATHKVELVIEGHSACSFLQPRFINDHTIQFVIESPYAAETRPALLDLSSGSIHSLQNETQDWDWVAAAAVSPDATEVAQLGETHTDAAHGAHSFLLRVSSTDSGRTLYTRRLGYICYCDGDWTPAELRWSSDGSILLVAVPLSDGHGVYTLNSQGRDVRAAAEGAYPRWIGSSRAFVYQDRSGNWLRVDSLYAKPKLLFKTTRALGGPAFSPDQTKIAFWDVNEWSLLVFDTGSKKLTTLAKMRISPLWLDNDTVLSTGVKTCNCEGYGFTGVSWSTSLTTGRSTRLGSFSWADADVLR